MEDKNINIEIDASLSEESIVKRTELFNQHVVPYKNLIYHVCIQYANCKREIPDIYTNVLVNFFKYIESYDSQRPLTSWIYAIAQRYVWDYNKRNSDLNITYSTDLSYIEGNVTSLEVSYTHLGRENYREIYSEEILYALDQLSVIHKEALILRMAGYRITEIADIAMQNGTMITYNIETIKGRIFLAKRKLRKLLTEDGKRRYE